MDANRQGKFLSTKIQKIDLNIQRNWFYGPSKTNILINESTQILNEICKTSLCAIAK